MISGETVGAGCSLAQRLKALTGERLSASRRTGSTPRDVAPVARPVTYGQPLGSGEQSGSGLAAAIPPGVVACGTLVLERGDMTAAALPVEQFDLRSLEPADRAEGWRDVLAATHLPWDTASGRASPEEPSAWVRRVAFGETAIVDCGCDPCSGVRGRREIESTPGEFIGVLMNLQGREVLAQDGRSAELTPGEMVVWDSRRPAEFAVLEVLRKRTVFFCRDQLAAFCPQLDRLTAVELSPRSPAVRLLVAYLEALSSTLPTLDPWATVAAHNASLELLAAALRPDAVAGSEPMRAGLHALACQYIERRLGVRSLTPESVARALGVSLRTLQLAFEEQGDSVAAFVRRRRLARAHAELSRRDDVSVTEVAFRWGFVDSAHFARVFKRAYGISPRQVREHQPA